MGVADGVGGWVDSGVDPSLFSQALMYHAHRYSKTSWPGEPEIDPTQPYEEREQVEGWELTPQECLELAHGGVLRERGVVCGTLPNKILLCAVDPHILMCISGSSTACIVNLNAGTGVLRSAK